MSVCVLVCLCSEHQQQPGVESEQIDPRAAAGEMHLDSSIYKETFCKDCLCAALSSHCLLPLDPPPPPQGILGTVKSGRTALVNKYVTGSYVAVEKPDGEEHLELADQRDVVKFTCSDSASCLPQVDATRRRCWWTDRVTCC